MKRLGALLVIGVALSLAAPAQAVVLVTPQGQLVGGKWQRWANESKVPTIATLVVMEDPAGFCIPQDAVPNTYGCSTGPPFYGSPYYALAASDRTTLYFELGHLFDLRYLTTADRQRFARLWLVPRAPWFDSTAALAQAREDGLMAYFAAAYSECAAGHRFDGLLVIGPRATATVTDQMCGIIRKIARRS